MTIGYTRQLVRGESARTDAAALRASRAERVFTEGPHAKGSARPELAALLADLQSGDILLVSSAARLSHSIGHFTSTVSDLTARGISFRSLAEPVLSTDGELASPMETITALDLLRRELLSLRTREGLADAVARGGKRGRPTVMTAERVQIAVELRAHDRSFAQIGTVLGVSPGAVRRALAASSPPQPASR